MINIQYHSFANMLLRELFEARKNPEQNPKTSINQAIKQALEQSPGTIAGVPNVFVSFTVVDKLGVNPRSHLEFIETPLGVYSYPASYVRDVLKDDRAAYHLPFAGGSKFANIFSMHGNIINIATISAAEIKPLIKLIAQYLQTFGNQAIEQSLERAIGSTNQAGVRTSGGKFWYITRIVAQAISNQTGSPTPVAWNKLFRSIGVDGVIDARTEIKGRSIIHKTEPIQAVVFSTNNIGNIERVMNRYSPEAVGRSTVLGDSRSVTIKQLKQMTVDDYQQAIDLLQKHGWFMFKYINDPALKSRIEQEFPDYRLLIDRQLIQQQINRYKPFQSINRRLEKLLLANPSKSTRDIIDYCNRVKGRWPEAEQKIMNGGLGDGAQYAWYIMNKQRWPEYEQIILRNRRVDDIEYYTRVIIKGRWPEAEHILRGSHKWTQYANNFGIEI